MQTITSNVINRKLIAQLVDASGSVGANYREANDDDLVKSLKRLFPVIPAQAGLRPIGPSGPEGIQSF